MKGAYGALAILLLAALAAFWPQPMAWAYVLAFMLFEFWLLRRLKREGSAPAPVGQAPYYFTDEEAAFIGRYRLYFAEPALAHAASSMLSALGLSALVLSPWLLLRQHYVPAVLVAVNLVAVGSLTKRLAPMLALRVAANKGDRAALRMLEMHDPLWKKINAANAGNAEAAR